MRPPVAHYNRGAVTDVHASGSNLFDDVGLRHRHNRTERIFLPVLVSKSPVAPLRMDTDAHSRQPENSGDAMKTEEFHTLGYSEIAIRFME